MKIRLYIEEGISECGERFNLLADRARYLSSVLRVKAGTFVYLFNSLWGEYECRVESVNKNCVVVRVVQQVKPPELARVYKVSLAFCLIKPSNITRIIDNCTQVGVDRFIPLCSQNSPIPTVGIGRLLRVAIEAVEQSGSLRVPKVDGVSTLQAFIRIHRSSVNTGGAVRIIHCNETLAKDNGITRLLLDGMGQEPPKETIVLIGPEGGFSEEEVGQLSEISCCRGVSLGSGVLRADNAATVASFLVQQVLDLP